MRGHWLQYKKRLAERMMTWAMPIYSNQIRIEKNNLTEGLYFFQLQDSFGVIGTGKLMIE